MRQPARVALPWTLAAALAACAPTPGGEDPPDVRDAIADAAHDIDANPDGMPPDANPDPIDTGARDAIPDPIDADPIDAAPRDATPDPTDVGPRDAAPDPTDAAPEPDAAPPPAPRTAPLITEVMASNRDTLLDDDGESSDWIELYNPSGAPYDLTGHHLTDDLDEPTRWRFPAVELPPGGYLVVFASGADRAAPDAPLHTDFRLSADGETVALTDPDGAVLHALEDWPAQHDGITWGLPMRVERATLLDAGAPARLWIGADPPGAAEPGFDDADWLPIAQGAGVDDRAPPRAAAAPLDGLRTDLGERLGPADAFWLRIPFDIPSAADDIELELTFDDGIAAWVDGAPIYAENEAVAGAADRPDSRALAPARVPLGPRAAGPGLLALRVVDAPVADGLFFAHAALRRPGIAVDPAPRYLATPTPGGPNLGDPAGEPPLVVGLDRDLPLSAGERLRIGAQVVETTAPIGAVTLFWRVMFAPEQPLEMLRVGDAWLAELPVDVAAPGEMLRWRVEAVDVSGRRTRWPPFPDPLDSEEYYGTVVDDPTIESNLPVYHWFVEHPDAAATEAGTRGALFYDGELYDNIEIDLHGQATTQFPKKSYNFDFNRDHRFRVRDDLERVEDLDLLTNYADKSKMRNTLSYGMFRDAGHAWHLTFPVRVHRNGEFFAVYEFVEDPDERWLRRMGHTEPLGAVYKCYDRLESVAGSEKKTRRDEGTDDLAAFIEGLGARGEAQRVFIHDNVDLAGMANFLAMLFITSGRDCCTKNYYAFHDYQTDMWHYLPWDIDLSLGRNWTGSYFDDRMFPDNPLYEGQENRLIGALYAMPTFLEMYHRRVRTLADEQMQPPGTPYADRYLENEADRWMAIIGADAELDNAAWPTWGQPQTMAEAVRIMKEVWLPGRRQYIYGELAQQAAGPVRTLIDGRPGAATARYRVPLDDALGEAWTAPDFDDRTWPEGPLGFGYEDGSGYEALIGTEVRPAALHPAATTVMLRVPFEVDDPAVAALTLRVKYDDGYVAWLNGVEVARRNVGPGPVGWQSVAAVHDDGAAMRFESVDVTAFAEALRPGRNVLALRLVNAGADSSDLLIQPELIDGLPGGDGPLPPAQAPDPDVVVEAAEPSGVESYVVLHNREAVAVDLSGWRVSGRGVAHTLRAGTVIPAGGRLYVVADVPAFRARAEGPRGGQGLFVQGNWRGALALPGEVVLEAPR